MSNFERDAVQKTEAYFLEQQFPTETMEIDGETVSYYVMPQRLEPALPDFAFRMTYRDEEMSSTKGIFGVSDSVPEELRPWWVRHEYEEFVRIGHEAIGCCAEAEKRVLVVIPEALRPDYLSRRMRFFANLIPYFQLHPKQYDETFISEAQGTLFLLQTAIRNDLVVQPSDTPIACSAYSLVNALTLKGVSVIREDTDRLIGQVVQHRLPLSNKDEQEFLAQYGYTIGLPWAPEAENIQTVGTAIATFATYIEKHGPVLLDISTFLSKRDQSIVPRICVDSDWPKVHRVVAIASRGVIAIIDPYKPTDPEVFCLAQQEDQIKFLAWLCSVYFQEISLPDATTSDELLSHAVSAIQNEHKFPMIAQFGIMKASLQHLREEESGVSGGK